MARKDRSGRKEAEQGLEVELWPAVLLVLEVRY